MAVPVSLCFEDILLRVEAESCEDVLRLIANRLYCEGKVKPEYERQLIAREKDYPTGLPLGLINVAIPHTDYQYSNVTQLVVATMARPIEWRSMEDSDEIIAVSAVVLSLFDRPEHQLEALQGIMRILQNQELVAKLVSAESPQQIVDVFNRKEQ